MPDFVYLLENRLSADQRNALSQLRAAARDAGSILFLTGDAVRDLTSGHAVRDLELAIHGNALKLKKPLEKMGGKVWGEEEATRSLYLCFPGTVRVDLVSTHAVEYPKPGKPVYRFASIQEDLRRRDFTVNSMAISLNEGSYGLLMDPLNGAADVEARILRLVSNYGFIEDPSLMIRAIRYRARLSWEMDARTQARYDNAKTEGTIEFLSTHARSQELEQIGHEEEGLKVLRALEAEGWMKVLFPAWTSAKADEAKLTALHDLAVELLVQGVHPDMSAAQMQLLTAKMQSKDLSALKKALLRPGFVSEWNELDRQASGFAKVLLSKQNAKPSASYKLFMSYDPEAILWLGFTSKDKAVQERFNQFLKVWPEFRQRIPYLLMQEMRITPELPSYSEVVQKIFLQLIDGHLTTPEQMRAFLESFSPPAPPPQVTIKRTRARRSEARVKEPAFEEESEAEEGMAAEEDLEPIGADDEELDMVLPKGALAVDIEDEEEGEDEDDLEGEEEKAAGAGKKRGAAPAAETKGQKASAGKGAKPQTAKVETARVTPAANAKSLPAAAPKTAAAKPAVAPMKAAPVVAQKAAAAKPAVAPTKAKPAAPKPRTVPTKKPTPIAAKTAKGSKPAAKPKPAAKAIAKIAAKPTGKLKPSRPHAKPAKKAHAKPSKPAARVSKKR
ncbi:tRNA nucleotidyltransferase/poly(A) polymerase family protein [Candidatus Sulfotelmatomonas gaucii]|uniref:tRNA nucleotidyltransferase/poly(A) polymerase family protein n=1 Tax=Candidatus Sulfuritelmatomonas gaucii TaxID=2043161 RepID=A0A2N9L7D8_9BACT|nr:tRNA nucleotidyltransferase/poly(A) polymerase family protein [Candidatus Sulfotelmatomonas gaucii]